MRFDVVVRYWEQAKGERRSFEAPYTVEAKSASEALARAEDRFDELSRLTSASEARGIESIEVVFESSGDPARWNPDGDHPTTRAASNRVFSDDSAAPIPSRRRTDT